MNRREALAALMSLPQVARISVADLKPDDVLVFECESPVSQDTAERIKSYAQEVFPGRKCIVVSDMTLKVMKG
jgi:hypothetical protein